MKKILLIFLILADLAFAEGLIKKAGNYYRPKEGTESQGVFFPYYATEAGMMFGHFYYNTDFLDKDAYFTNIFMYTPTKDIGVDWLTMKDYPISPKWKIGTSLFLARFAEIRNYQIGNYGSDSEIEYSMADSSVSRTDGYDFGKGSQYKVEFSLDRDITSEDRLSFIYSYIATNNEMQIAKDFAVENDLNMQTELNDKTDKLQIEWKKDTRDDKLRPMKGKKIVLGFEKSLNFLSNDSENDWDYYRIRLDYSEHFKLRERSTLSLRFYTVNFEYLKDIDDNQMDSMDMPVLGDLDTFRGYYYSRYRDKNSVLWQGEYRFPISKDDSVRMSIFGELGRVGEDYNAELFYKDLKWDAGFGLKYFFNEKVMIRGDFAFSDEAAQIRFSTKQAF